VLLLCAAVLAGGAGLVLRAQDWCWLLCLLAVVVCLLALLELLARAACSSCSRGLLAHAVTE